MNSDYRGRPTLTRRRGQIGRPISECGVQTPTITAPRALRRHNILIPPRHPEPGTRLASTVMDVSSPRSTISRIARKVTTVT